MNTREKLAVFDGNWLLHRLYHVFQKHESQRPMATRLAYGAVHSILKDALDLRATHLLVAFDGFNVSRYRILPSYKITRMRNYSLEIGNGMKELMALLEETGIRYRQEMEMEADDILATAALLYGDPYGCQARANRDSGYGLIPASVVCVCRDKDVFQCVTETVTMYDPSARDSKGKPKPEVIDRKAVLDKTGLWPEQMVDYQTLIGDRSDNIPAIPGFTPARARGLLQAHGSIDNWMRTKQADTKILIQKEREVKRNRALVKLFKSAFDYEPLDNYRLAKKKSGNQQITGYYQTYYDFVYPRTRSLF